MASKQMVVRTRFKRRFIRDIYMWATTVLFRSAHLSGVSGGSSASRGPIPACPSAASSRLTGKRHNATSCALTMERPKGLELGGWGGAKSASRLQLAADRPPAGALRPGQHLYHRGCDPFTLQIVADR